MHINIFTNEVQYIVKMKNRTKSCYQYIRWVALALLTLIFAGRKDNDDTARNFDPGKPAAISEFGSKEGGLEI